MFVFVRFVFRNDPQLSWHVGRTIARASSRQWSWLLLSPTVLFWETQKTREQLQKTRSAKENNVTGSSFQQSGHRPLQIRAQAEHFVPGIRGAAPRPRPQNLIVCALSLHSVSRKFIQNLLKLSCRKSKRQMNRMENVGVNRRLLGGGRKKHYQQHHGVTSVSDNDGQELTKKLRTIA